MKLKLSSVYQFVAVSFDLRLSTEDWTDKLIFLLNISVFAKVLWGYQTHIVKFSKFSIFWAQSGIFCDFISPTVTICIWTDLYQIFYYEDRFARNQGLQ